MGTSVGPSPASIRDAIIDVYMKKNPCKLSEVDGLMTKYTGRELLMHAALCCKYNEFFHQCDR